MAVLSSTHDSDADCYSVFYTVFVYNIGSVNKQPRKLSRIILPMKLLCVISSWFLCCCCIALIIYFYTALSLGSHNKHCIKAIRLSGGTVAAVPPPFRLGDPALCGSHPLVTPYECRLADLLCFLYVCALIVFLCYLCIFCSFSTLILLVWSFYL